MEKFALDAETFGKISLLCEDMGVAPDVNIDHKVADYLRETVRIGRLFTEEVETFTDRADDALGEMYDKDMAEAVDELAKMVDQLGEFEEYVESLRETVAGTLTALRDFTEPSGWTPLRSDVEMECAIENGFALTNEITLGYQNGQYALLFETGEDQTPVADPFVFAVGRDEDLDEIRAYVESFLDMEDEA